MPDGAVDGGGEKPEGENAAQFEVNTDERTEAGEAKRGTLEIRGRTRRGESLFETRLRLFPSMGIAVSGAMCAVLIARVESRVQRANRENKKGGENERR